MSTKTNSTTEPTIKREEETVVRLESKSQLIRRLFFKEGLPIKDISSKTGIRYQMVRNVVKSEQDKILISATNKK
jgi:hypothetical protein